jgi:hypothetical protein
MLLAAGCSHSNDAATTRIRDLPTMTGQVVTVRGRTGQIMEQLQQPGIGVFSLRDDYGDTALVRLHGGTYPEFGVTYLVTGTAAADTDHFYVDAEAAGVRPAYASMDPVVIAAVAAIVIVGGGAILFVVRRWMKRSRSGLPEPWGYLNVVQGDESATRFYLRNEITEVGRGVDPDRGVVCFVKDDTVSRSHGKIIREGNSYFYQDTSSRGSMVENRPVPHGERVTLRPGDVIDLGTAQAQLSFHKMGGSRPFAGEQKTMVATDVMRLGVTDAMRAEDQNAMRNALPKPKPSVRNSRELSLPRESREPTPRF